MFELMTESIKDDAVRYCFGVTIETKAERKAGTQGETKEQKAEHAQIPDEHSQMPKEGQKESVSGRHNPVERQTEKVGRNDPCPCGSGKKYKNCCGKEA
jgi:preprotein translocase subunit SecA